MLGWHSCQICYPLEIKLLLLLLPSVVLPIHPAKVCLYGNLHYVALKLFC